MGQEDAAWWRGRLCGLTGCDKSQVSWEPLGGKNRERHDLIYILQTSPSLLCGQEMKGVRVEDTEVGRLFL